MSALNILAVQNAPLLRALNTDPKTAKGELATVVGKDRSNLNRSIAALAEAGLIAGTDDGERNLTPDGVAQLAAIDRAEGQAGDEPGSRPADPASGMLALYHAQILPDPGNARRDWDSEEAKADLDALREDLLLNGLLQNLVVRPVPAGDLQGVSIERTDAAGARHILPLYRLVGGERRWRAIAIAISDGDWPEDRLIPCRELDADDLGCRLAALAENIQRRNLNPIEKARAFEGLAEAGLTNQQIAERIVATPEHVQQHRRFLQLDEADQQRMTLSRDDPRHLSVRDARAKLARKGEDDAPVELSPAARLVLGELAYAARKLDPRSWWIHTPVDPTAVNDPAVAELTALGVISVEGPYYQTGEFKAHIRYDGWTFAAKVLSWLKEGTEQDARDRGLCELQGIDPDGGPPSTYVTAWLNGPFDLTEEGKAIVAQRAEEAAARDAHEAERLAAIAERDARWAAARARHVALFAEAVDKPVWGEPEQTVQIAAEIDRPLPWAVTAAGKVMDANGKDVAAFGYYSGCSDQGLVTARMIVAAVNAAGGLATPAEPVAPAPNEDEPEQDIDGNDPEAEPDSEEFADDGADDRHPGEGRD